MAQRISSGVPVPVKSCTLMEDVSSCLDGIVAAWTFEVFVGEEPQPIFSNWSVISDGSCGTSTQRVRVTEDLKPRSFFGICRFDDVVIVVH